MKRAGSGTLARISPLLDELRARRALRETRPGVFALDLLERIDACLSTVESRVVDRRRRPARRRTRHGAS